MKFAYSLLALVASAFAADVDPRWLDDKKTTTLTTYTTTTVCPVTTTVTDKGT